MFHGGIGLGLQLGREGLVDLSMLLLWHPTALGVAGTSLAISVGFKI